MPDTILRRIDETSGMDAADRASPYSADERAYVMLMYQEHAEQARQQEFFKTLWSLVIACLLPILLVGSLDPARQFLCGVLLCAFAAIGFLMQGKHQERYELHLRVMRGFRAALARAVRPEIPAISHASSQSREGSRLFRLLNVRRFWSFVYLVAIAIGATLASQAEPPVQLARLAPWHFMTPPEAPARPSEPAPPPVLAPADKAP